jgi:hypothetical protein
MIPESVHVQTICGILDVWNMWGKKLKLDPQNKK